MTNLAALEVTGKAGCYRLRCNTHSLANAPRHISQWLASRCEKPKHKVRRLCSAKISQKFWLPHCIIATRSSVIPFKWIPAHVRNKLTSTYVRVDEFGSTTTYDCGCIPKAELGRVWPVFSSYWKTIDFYQRNSSIVGENFEKLLDAKIDWRQYCTENRDS